VTAFWTRINTFFLLILMLMGVTIIAILATRAEGGPIDPQGTPGSTLPQVEPRNPIPPIGWNGTFPIEITMPGSYFLTRNLTGGGQGLDAIFINGDDVSLDLNGFRLERQGMDGSPRGVRVATTADRAVISNGTVLGWTVGIDAFGSPGVRITDVRVSGGFIGLWSGSGGVIEDCTVHGNGDIGIIVGAGVVRRCVVFSNVTNGINAVGSSLIEDNHLSGNGSGVVNRSNIHVTGSYNYVRDNVVIAPAAGAPTFRIDGTNNHFLRNYYVCGTVVDNGGNFFPAAVDLVDTNYC
jgi:parallel beta-helix repeat protein